MSTLAFSTTQRMLVRNAFSTATNRRMNFPPASITAIIRERNLDTPMKTIEPASAWIHTKKRMSESDNSAISTDDSGVSAYPFADVEARWQSYWDENHTFRTPDRDQKRGKKYVLDMFPYPR